MPKQQDANKENQPQQRTDGVQKCSRKRSRGNEQEKEDTLTGRKKQTCWWDLACRQWKSGFVTSIGVVSLHLDSTYEEMVAEGVAEAMKERPSTKTIRRLMRNTFPRRRKWILDESPTVASVLEVSPP